MVERLTEAGLYSPARIVRAGLEALEAVPGLGEKKAAAILQAAIGLDRGAPAVSRSRAETQRRRGGARGRARAPRIAAAPRTCRRAEAG